MISKSYEFYIFDFDGVIVDSNKLKTEAFRHALSGYPTDAIDAFVKYHRANGGISRWEKFKHFLTEIVSNGYSDEKVEALAEEYSRQLELVLKNLVLTPGTLEILTILRKREIPCYIVSGAKEAEVVSISKKLGIYENFEKILGSPRPKEENVSLVIKEMDGKKGVFIGDATTDLKCAEMFELDFIFQWGYTELEDWDKIIPRKYRRVKNISEYLNDLS